MSLPKAEQERRKQALEKRHADYDPQEQLIKRWFGSEYNYNWFLRNGYAHPTRDSLSYAVALLDAYDDAFLDRAQDILRRIIEIQEADPKHQHYGVWPHLMEEPLGKGPYVDRNWADFLGKDLMHVMIYHKDRLPENLVAEVEASLRRAVEAIRIRNVRPGYTNISVMSSFVTLVSGETLGDEEILARGVERVRELHEHTQALGTFSEYNSPTYTMVALRDLATFRHHVKHPEAKGMVDDLFRVAWETLAQHFHPPTRQWVGPSSRYYAVFIGEDALRFIERWTGPNVDFGLGEMPGDPHLTCMDARCPEDLEDLLVSLSEPRTVVQTVLKREILPLVTTTYLTPDVALGSINHQDMWNQRRNAIAFWGGHKTPSYCRVRLIYNGYDLSTGALWARQDANRVLGVVTFATDGGGKHLSLEKLKDGTFEAEALSLRFEFGGPAAAAHLPRPEKLEDPIALKFGDVALGIHVPFAVFDDCDIHWDTGRAEEPRTGEVSFLDVTFHRGENRVFKLPDVKQAAVAFALQVGGGAFEPAQAALEGETLRVTWGNLGISTPVRPNTYGAMRAAVEGVA